MGRKRGEIESPEWKIASFVFIHLCSTAWDRGDFSFCVSLSCRAEHKAAWTKTDRQTFRCSNHQPSSFSPSLAWADRTKMNHMQTKGQRHYQALPARCETAGRKVRMWKGNAKMRVSGVSRCKPERDESIYNKHVTSLCSMKTDVSRCTATIITWKPQNIVEAQWIWIIVWIFRLCLGGVRVPVV